MAIQFARIKYVSRKTGGNACHKAAYNQREKIECERTGQVFNFQHKTDLSHHEVMLPKGVSDKFKDSSYLWNAAEKAERRVDSQVAKEGVIALPDDKIITAEDRIELTRRFVDLMFVSKGLGVQFDIHAPHDTEKNWHAHLLITTRGFSKDGEDLSTHKARDTDPIIRKGFVVEETYLGKMWAELQQRYFDEKGYDLKVDPVGIIFQEHMGPVRMRAHLTDIVERCNLLKEANEQAFRNPGEIIKKLTNNSSVFDVKSVQNYVRKFIKEEDIPTIVQKVLNHKSLVPLFDGETKCGTGYFTTKAVRAEEEKIIRFADKISREGGKNVSEDLVSGICIKRGLSAEQEKALKHVVLDAKGIAFIQGRAGTGKSYTMNAIREAYESSNYKVIGMAPTHSVVGDMSKDGFKTASTVHKFLFDVKNERIRFPKKSVIVVDEAAMLGNQVLLELLNLAKEKKCKLVLFGDSKQLSSVERGGMFDTLAQTHGNVVLQDVRRQEVDWQKKVSELLGEGDHRQAIHLLEDAKAIQWAHSKEEALSKLVSEWTKSYLQDPNKERLVLANKNIDVDILNRAMREIRLKHNHVSAKGYEMETARGREIFSENDRIVFTLTRKDLKISNGDRGTITSLSEKECTVMLDNKNTVSFKPASFDGLKLGYAITTYKSQGKTVPEIFYLHDKTSHSKLSYVGLSRQKNLLKVFVNKAETKNIDHLIAQSSKTYRNLSSLAFVTADQLDREAVNTNAPLMKAKEAVSSWVTAIKDKFHTNEEFYRLPSKQKSPKGVVKAVDQNFLLTGGQQKPHEYSHKNEVQITPDFEAGGLKVPTSLTFAPHDTKPIYTTKMVKSEMDKEAVKHELINNLESVVSCLNKNKPHSKTPYDERYGKNGSLRIFTAGQRRGTFDCYESDIRGGDVFALISHLEGGRRFVDCLEWGREFLGGNFRNHLQTVKVHPEVTKTGETTASTWKQVCPVPSGMTLPTAQEISSNKWLNKKLENGTTIEDIYAYKNQDGSLNFGVYRLRHSDGSKGILPITVQENHKGFQAWRWKGLEGQKPLYGLEKIGSNPERDILVVEGEKTANAAQRLFPEYTTISWSSGAGSAHKSDWSSLQGKNVIIWPDNDQGGIKAGEKVVEILAEINKNCEKVPMVAMVKIPSCFKEKWDLADEFPQGWNKDKARDLIDHSLGKIKDFEKEEKGEVSISPKVQEHIHKVMEASYHIEPKEINPMMMKEIHHHLNLMEKLYESAKLMMNEEQKHHHIKQACYIGKSSQNHMCLYRSCSPSQARERAMKQATFEATMIKRSDSFSIDVPKKFEVYNDFKKRFEEAVDKTQEKMIVRYPGHDSYTLYSAAHTQVTLMALTANKIDLRNFMDEKMQAVSHNVSLIEEKAKQIVLQSHDPEKDFKQTESGETAKSAIIHEIIRREPDSSKQEGALVNTAFKEVHLSITTYQKDREQAIQLEQKNTLQRNRDQGLSI